MGNFEEWRKMNESATRIRLTQQNFSDLVNGKEIETDGVKIILADIGFSNMKAIIDKAHKEHF